MKQIKSVLLWSNRQEINRVCRILSGCDWSSHESMRHAFDLSTSSLPLLISTKQSESLPVHRGSVVFFLFFNSRAVPGTQCSEQLMSDTFMNWQEVESLLYFKHRAVFFWGGGICYRSSAAGCCWWSYWKQPKMPLTRVDCCVLWKPNHLSHTMYWKWFVYFCSI